MFAVVLLFSPLVNACDVANNNDDGLNYLDCNNAGRCVQAGSHTMCECCDPFDADNFCFGKQDFKFTGDSCTTAEYTFAVGFGWRFETAEGSTPAVTCSDMETDPPAAGGLGYQTNVNLMTPVMAALKKQGYDAISYGAACKTCREDSPCDYSGQGPVYEGVTAGFATELNTFYERSCVSYSISQPADCAANDDLGLSAMEALYAAFGDNGANITPVFNTFLDGSNEWCLAKPALCKSFTDTTATVFSKTEFKASGTLMIPTVAPTPQPTDEIAAPAPAPACSNGPWQACGGTYHMGETCCPAGFGCYNVVPSFALCAPTCMMGWSCNN